MKSPPRLFSSRPDLQEQQSELIRLEGEGRRLSPRASAPFHLVLDAHLPNRVLSLPRSSSFHMLFPLPEPHTPHPPLCPTFTTALGVLSGEVSLAAQGALGTSSTLCADS